MHTDYGPSSMASRSVSTMQSHQQYQHRGRVSTAGHTGTSSSAVSTSSALVLRSVVLLVLLTNDDVTTSDHDAD